LSDAAGGTGDHRDLSFNRVHIDGSTGRRLKGTNFGCVEARLLDGSRDNGIHKSLLQSLPPVVSPSFAFASPFFAIAQNTLTEKADRSKIKQFQAATAGRSLKGNTPWRWSAKKIFGFGLIKS
jgi:hypothetical protein